MLSKFLVVVFFIGCSCRALGQEDPFGSGKTTEAPRIAKSDTPRTGTFDLFASWFQDSSAIEELQLYQSGLSATSIEYRYVFCPKTLSLVEICLVGARDKCRFDTLVFPSTESNFKDAEFRIVSEKDLESAGIQVTKLRDLIRSGTNPYKAHYEIRFSKETGRRITAILLHVLSEKSP